MRYLLWAPCLLFWFCASSQISEPFIKKYYQSITPGTLKQQLSIIAGAEMEGRLTATEGQRKAAAYIEDQMRSFGLQPGNGESFQMQYPLYRDSTIAANLSVNGKPFEINKSFSVLHRNYTAEQNFNEILFIDFDDTLFTNDHLNLSGKLLMFDSEDKPKKGGAISDTKKIEILQRKGAAAVLVIQKKFPLTSPEALVSEMDFNRFPSSQTINRYSIGHDVASAIVGKNYSEIKGCRFFSVEISLNYSKALITQYSSNVLGALYASKPTDEWIFITAHYDHLGKKDDIIWFGADDDGSGTTAVLELAKTFCTAKANGMSVRQNIMFMTVSGEEQGLFGSRYFVDHPVVPLEKISADLNIDMIGRSDSAHLHKLDSNYLYVIGDDKLSSELPAIAREANRDFQLQLDSTFNDPKDKHRLYYRSDHYNFASRGVPAMFYYDGGHPDYHRPTDTVDKIDFDLMALRTRYIFVTACLIANRKHILKRDLDPKAVGKR